MYKYKTKDGLDYVVQGVGRTIGGYISSPHVIENPNLELVTETPEVPAQPAPGHVEGVVPQNAQPPVPPVQPPQQPPATPPVAEEGAA